MQNSLQNCDSYVSTRRMGWIERCLAGERWTLGQLGSAEILHILSSLLQPGFGGMTGTISVISQGRHEKMAMFQSGSGVWTDVIYFILFQFKQLLGLILFDKRPIFNWGIFVYQFLKLEETLYAQTKHMLGPSRSRHQNTGWILYDTPQLDLETSTSKD